MRFLKKNAIYVLIGIVAVLAAFAVTISVMISIVMIEKKNQLAEARAYAARSMPVTAKSKETLNLGKVKKYPVFFNGSPVKAFDYYYLSDNVSLIPMDSLLKLLNIPFDIFNPDDVFQTSIDKRKLSVKLGTSKAYLDGSGITLNSVSAAADDHILVSSEILALPEGFKIDENNGADGVFLNRWLSARTKDFNSSYLLSISSGIPTVQNLFKTSTLAHDDKDPGKLDVVIYCPYISSYLLKGEGRTWLINKRNMKAPELLDIPVIYEVSTGGRYLYWEDGRKESLYVYDIENKNTREFKDYFARIGSNNGISSAELKLTDIRTGSRFTCVDFQENSSLDTYSIIERRGKIAAEGKSSLSPDRNRILFGDGGRGYFVINYDGSGVIKLEPVKTAEWIDNDRILLNTDNGVQIYDLNNKRVTNTGKTERYIGITNKGEVFYQKDDTVFSSYRGHQRELFELSWKCDFIQGNTLRGPFYIVSQEDDGILGIFGDKRLPLGAPSLFINKSLISTASNLFESNTALSPDNKKIALLQKGEKFLEVNIADLKGYKMDKLLIGLRVDNGNDAQYVNIKWIGNNSILIHNGSRVWLLDLKNGTHIYEWENDGSDKIIGLLQ